MACKKSSAKNKLMKKSAVSLTDQQYEEIFFAAIHPEETKYSPAAGSTGKTIKKPTEMNIVKSKPTCDPTNKQYASIFTAVPHQETVNSKSKSTPTDSPRNDGNTSSPISNCKSANFNNNSMISTPSTSISLNDPFADLVSQPPRKLAKRDRLLWLQEKRCTGMYVKCDQKHCGKWRWLDNPDPVDLPRKWFCNMNPDESLAGCSVPETPVPRCVKEDLVQNCYTPGSIVWAKLTGYPWWPAMVDDCPDCEQYYWINDITKSDIPDWYNVVFFDNKEVERQWVLVKNLKSFKHNPNLDKKHNVKLIYKKRMNAAKQKAIIASRLHIRDRLKRYSFLALWNKEIPEYLTSSDDCDSDINESFIDYARKIKKKIIQRKRAAALKNRSQDVNVDTIEQRENQTSLTSDENTRMMNMLEKINKELVQSSSKESQPESSTISKKDSSGSSQNLKSSDNNRVFKTIKQLLNNNKCKYIYQYFFHVYTSGKDGENTFKKMYKEICCINSCASSSESETSENRIPSNLIEENTNSQNKMKENGESTRRDEELQNSRKEEPKMKKRKLDINKNFNP